MGTSEDTCEVVDAGTGRASGAGQLIIFSVGGITCSRSFQTEGARLIRSNNTRMDVSWAAAGVFRRFTWYGMKSSVCSYRRCTGARGSRRVSQGHGRPSSRLHQHRRVATKCKRRRLRRSWCGTRCRREHKQRMLKHLLSATTDMRVDLRPRSSRSYPQSIPQSHP